MLDLNEHSITNWAIRVANDRLLCAACGFEFGKAPSFSSYYDFIDRIWKASAVEHKKRRIKPKSFYSKPRKKLKAGQKLPLSTQELLKNLFLFQSGVNSERRDPSPFFKNSWLAV